MRLLYPIGFTSIQLLQPEADVDEPLFTKSLLDSNEDDSPISRKPHQTSTPDEAMLLQNPEQALLEL
jgi:hypothetical protein